MHTAKSVTNKSTTPATTRTGLRGLPNDVFTAAVTIEGKKREYLFRGHHHDPDAVAIGYVGFNPAQYNWSATGDNGKPVTKTALSREEALRALVREARR